MNRVENTPENCSLHMYFGQCSLGVIVSRVTWDACVCVCVCLQVVSGWGWTWMLGLQEQLLAASRTGLCLLWWTLSPSLVTHPISLPPSLPPPVHNLQVKTACDVLEKKGSSSACNFSEVHVAFYLFICFVNILFVVYDLCVFNRWSFTLLAKLMLPCSFIFGTIVDSLPSTHAIVQMSHCR